MALINKCTQSSSSSSSSSSTSSSVIIPISRPIITNIPISQSLSKPPCSPKTPLRF